MGNTLSANNSITSKGNLRMDGSKGLFEKNSEEVSHLNLFKSLLRI